MDSPIYYENGWILGLQNIFDRKKDMHFEWHVFSN